MRSHADFTLALARYLQAWRLTPAQFELLRYLASSGGPVRLSELSRRTTLSSSGVTRALDGLIRENLVERVPCPEDRRSTHAVLAVHGRQTLTRVLPGYRALVARFTQPLSEGEVGALARHLEALTRPSGGRPRIRTAPERVDA